MYVVRQRDGNGRACAHRVDVWRGVVIQFHSSQPRHQMELSGQLYSPAALTRKEQHTVTLISMTYDNSVCKLKRNQLVMLREINVVSSGKHISADFMAICCLLKCCKQSLQCPVLLKVLYSRLHEFDECGCFYTIPSAISKYFSFRNISIFSNETR